MSAITRYVWAGDQVLWELRAPGADGQNLESVGNELYPSSQAYLFGQVSYLHAGGIDRPLTIWKRNVGTVRPHQNWRGLFASGTWGTSSVPGAPPVGTTANCVTVNVNECLPINWPGDRTSAWHESRGGESALWMGGLVDGMRDPTGQVYMRNRYYNPQTGQFTQMDPIGLAGGLNTYGFAAGDPVTYSDPYGLRVVFQDNADGDRLRRLWNDTKAAAREAMRSDDEQIAAAGRVLFNSMQEMEDSRSYTLRVGTHSESSGNPWGRTATERRGSRLASSAQMTFSAHPSRNFFDLSERMQAVVLSHEVGHAWTAMNFVQSAELHEQYTNPNANNFENLSRRITGCGGYRPSHNVGGSIC